MTKYLMAMFLFWSLYGGIQAQNDAPPPPPSGPNGQRPTVAQIFEHMDANKDNHLSKKEVRGPLTRDFDRVDANRDGLISRAELRAAPKPPRRDGQAPPPRPAEAPPAEAIPNR